MKASIRASISLSDLEALENVAVMENKSINALYTIEKNSPQALGMPRNYTHGLYLIYSMAEGNDEISYK